MNRFKTLSPIIGLLGLFAGSSCQSAGGLTLLPISPVTVEVHESLRLPLDVEGGANQYVLYQYEGPDLPGLDRTTTISGDAAGGEFRWTPLVSHVGSHEFRFSLMDGSQHVISEQTTTITVVPSEDAAPIFLRPGAGDTYYLDRDPCVVFQVEVRDDDSSRVEISTTSPLPEGATLDPDGTKRALFQWCPSVEQQAESERWTIRLQADDSDHPPTESDYVIVLRNAPREGCPGAAPEIVIDAPDEGERLETAGTYTITTTVTDDGEIPDVPLLYYSGTQPEDLEKPDLTEFSQIEFELAEGSTYSATITDLGLEVDESKTIYFVVSATDNDDPETTLCDHRTDSVVQTFLAVRGEGSPDIALCGTCASSADCAAGTLCVTAASGARCLDECSLLSPACPHGGTCALSATVEGSSAANCGSVAIVCEGATVCTETDPEDNDSRGTATALSTARDGRVCDGDADYYSFVVGANSQVTVTVTYDAAGGSAALSLQTSDSTLGTSDSGSGTETATYCNATERTLYARVGPHGTDEPSYRISISSAPCDADVCTADALETGSGDDTRETAAALADDVYSLCAGDPDFRYVDVTESTELYVRVENDSLVDIDIYLYDSAGTQITRAFNSWFDYEELSHTLTSAGRYYIEFRPFTTGAETDYLVEHRLTSLGGCMADPGGNPDVDCTAGADGEVCSDAGMCESFACATTADCPTAHVCPDGPSAMNECGWSGCTSNGSCRGSESCKRGIDGQRYCSRIAVYGINGAACAGAWECGGQRTCLDWPGGYCARASCASSPTICESTEASIGITTCVMAGGEDVCAKRCTGEADCRDGYSCVSTPLAGAAGTEMVCVPD